ncbi:uncharacterized protein EI90DRAFT_3044767 [Cantharellus anzutake]|uniref:uncharacterized protein n=1 Tax=Cantharellus anzutake TaxID=1750568 RepID=UPI0019055DE3|nr:uncharacterized protein EI90DRAFT_3044767 [Cantharellus anzutake]KAF8337066.1 hypothetical protein EI90DRAFT_3044767 [Cantharellus anzutake]
MILANKWVLNKTDVPCFFLFMQLSIAVVLLVISHYFKLIHLTLRLDPTTVKALAPMISINVLGLNFNNLTLKFVDASFYQVARGLLLPITVALSHVFLHTRPPVRILCSCAVVTLGFFVGILIDSPWTFGGTVVKPPSLIGVTFGILSSTTTALHAVVIKRSLEAVNGSTLQLAWYSNLVSALVMIPVIFVAGEVPAILELWLGLTPAGEGVSPLATFVWGSIITGGVGFLINIAGFLSIKITSPITHMVSAAVRGVLQTFLSVALFKDIVTRGRWASIVIILGGSIYYTWVKNEETAAARRRFNGSAPKDEESGGSARGFPSSLSGRPNGAYEPIPLQDVGEREVPPVKIESSNDFKGPEA